MWKNIVLINLRSKLRWKDRLLVRLAKLKSCSLGLKESPLSDFVFFPLCFQVDGNLGSVGITSRVQPFTINFIKCSDTQSHAERFKAMQKQFNCKEREETTLLKLPSVLFVIVSFAFQIIIVWWLVYYFWSLLKRRKQSDNISNASACLFLQLSAHSQQRWHIPALFLPHCCWSAVKMSSVDQAAWIYYARQLCHCQPDRHEPSNQISR